MSRSGKFARRARQRSTAAQAARLAPANGLAEKRPARNRPPAGNRVSSPLLRLCLLALASLLAHKPLQAQQPPAEPGVQLEAGIEKEEVIGDLKSAIEIYQKIAADTLASREVRARALLRLAGCDEKLGRPARQIYEQIVREFADQPSAAQARKRLAVLAQQQRPPPLTTMSDRTIEWSRLGVMGPADTDGERAVYASGDNLYFGDLGGRNKRLTVATKRFGWLPCRDFALVLLDLLSTPTRQHTLAVIKPDGAGYRTLIRDDAKNTIFQQDQPFAMSCSWDDRNVLLSDFSPRSTLSGQLWIVSVPDGHRRVLVDVQGWRIRKAVFSPDGRYAAYEVWPVDPASPRTSRVFIVPLNAPPNAPLPGGEPQLAYESAPWPVGNPSLALMDWTADGRYLALHDVRQGKSALYLLPVKDGAAAGPTSFVRFGNFDDGYTTASGALVYEDKDASPSSVEASVASIDPDDRLGDWQPIDLNASSPWPSFSADAAQIARAASGADLTSVSPDGKSIARLLDETVSIRPAAGGEWKPLASGVAIKIPPVFQPDGKWILYQTVDAAGRAGVFRVSVAGGNAERLGDLPNNGPPATFIFSPDGRKALAVTEKPAAYGLSLLENFVPPIKK